jgi:hypothetical protein
MNPKTQALNIFLKLFIKFHLFLVLRIQLIIFVKSFPNKNVFQDYFLKTLNAWESWTILLRILTFILWIRTARIRKDLLK